MQVVRGEEHHLSVRRPSSSTVARPRECGSKAETWLADIQLPPVYELRVATAAGRHVPPVTGDHAPRRPRSSATTVPVWPRPTALVAGSKTSTAVSLAPRVWQTR